MTCLRCRGRMFRHHDSRGGPYTACLACGYVRWDMPPAPFDTHREPTHTSAASTAHERRIALKQRLARRDRRGESARRREVAR